MGWLDTLLGRSKPVKPNLDALFALPSAAVTLQAATGMMPSGLGSVSYRAAEGGAFATLEHDVKALVGERVEEFTDSYGYTWLEVRRTSDQIGDLVTELHAVNSSLESAGFGPSLLCSLVSFADPDGRRLAIVYLYKRGTFYPFAPLAGQMRDNALEMQARAALEGELPLEEDLNRWFPVWGAPGL
ncbi:PspA-associated protein PspAB [Nonomuraea sp. LPB2021202275-12-8]|uniref:PspA-associated protein PspAB n=1 Tax=Nonomuraea sp. LPB2021202275-12-8 TaxID=3120159 RepID=UPI00300CD43E